MSKAWEKDDVRSISRRYFISNGFDGTLTSIGIAVGSFLYGVPDGLTVFKVAAGGAVGLSTSGVWSVWEIEKAEKLMELHDLEDDMLEKLEGREVHREKKQGRIINAVMSGLGPILGIILPESAFLLEAAYMTMFQATLGALLIGMTLLFALGHTWPRFRGRTGGKLVYAWLSPVSLWRILTSPFQDNLSKDSHHQVPERLLFAAEFRFLSYPYGTLHSFLLVLGN